MKTSTIAVVSAIFGLVSNLAAQVTNLNPESSNVVSAYAVSERGAHYEVWSQVTAETTSDGDTLYTTNSLIERASGMNYWDGQQWAPSNPSFQISPNGGTATVSQVQNKISLAANLNTNGGAVTVSTADGLTLNSTPVGIALYDAASGNFTTVAWITNCTGYLVNSNKIVYSNAFAGLCADVVYTSERGAFHQDVVINGHLDPADYGFPSNTTRIQILTEYYQPPQPQAVQRLLQVQTNQTLRASMASPDFIDWTLGFGEFVMGPGRAYTAASGDPTFGGVPVGKQFVTITNQGATRTFLIESVAYPSIKKELDLLPECNGLTGRIEVEKKPFEYAVLPAAHPTAKTAAIFTQAPVRMASLERPTGVVIDYVGESGSLSNSFTFQSDTTYFISGPLYCNNSVTFEGGTVIKYPSTNTTAYIQLNSSATFSGSSYRPIILTAADDNSAGETLTTNAWSGYTGTIGGYYANPALWFQFDFSGTASNLGFRDAQQAVRLDAESAGSETVTISHSQFVNCAQAIEMAAGWSFGKLNIFNDLFTGVQYPFNTAGFGLVPTVTTLFQCTIDGMTGFDYGIYTNNLGDPYGYSFNADNCIFADTTDGGSYSVSGTNNGFYHFSYSGGSTFGTSPISTSTAPFQTIGAAEFYLANNCVFRNAGTTNIDATLLSQLQQKTTYPPLVIAGGSYSTNLTLYPQAQRDADTSLDVGYHYDPIDYAFGGVFLTNAAFTAQPGTVIAGFSTNGIVYGLTVGPGAQFICQGTPTSLNRIVNYNTVQEQATTNWSTTSQGLIEANWQTNGPASVLNFRFTDFSVLAQDTRHIYSLLASNSAPLNVQDCQFHGGTLLLDRLNLNFTNCLMERVNSEFIILGAQSNTLYLRNSLFWRGNINFEFLSVSNSTAVLIQDNMFDETTLNDHGFTNYTGGYNGYVTNFNTLTLLSHDVVLTNSSYQIGRLGSYYIPTNSLLINAGNTNANLLALYYYTTTTNQVAETNSLVDIGYHYVALGTNGLPVDTDGDGVPDYLEDGNGNGTIDSGETNPTDKRDFGLKVLITRPKNGSILP